jgi:hypothetical protein
MACNSKIGPDPARKAMRGCHRRGWLEQPSFLHKLHFSR